MTIPSNIPSSPFSALQSALKKSPAASKPATTEPTQVTPKQPSQPGGLIGHTVNTTA